MFYPYAAALLLGGALTLGYAPFSQWWVVLASLSGFVYLLSKSPVKQVFKLSFAFGLAWFGVGISWVHVSIADFGGIPLIGSVAIMLVLCSYLALFPATAFWTLHRYFPQRLWPLALPFIWLLIEWLRSWLLTGFPWLSLGYSQLPGPLRGWMPIIGEIGVSAFVVLVAGVIACWLPTMQKYKNMTEDHWDADVIIWPEAAVPKLEPVAADYLHQMDKLAIEHQTGLITGIVNYNFETREAFNNLIGLGLKDAVELPDLTQPPSQYYYGHDNRYAKHHLLPIGEFIPFENWLRGLAPIFDLPMSSFTRGAYQQQNIQAKGHYFAPALCFEIAQVRAKEFGLPVLRATNNGITAFIDQRGDIQSRLAQFEAAVLVDHIQLVSGKTPYRELGNLPIWLCAIFSFVTALYFRKRSRT